MQLAAGEHGQIEWRVRLSAGPTVDDEPQRARHHTVRTPRAQQRHMHNKLPGLTAG